MESRVRSGGAWEMGPWSLGAEANAEQFIDSWCHMIKKSNESFENVYIIRKQD